MSSLTAINSITLPLPLLPQNVTILPSPETSTITAVSLSPVMAEPESVSDIHNTRELAERLKQLQEELTVLQSQGTFQDSEGVKLLQTKIAAIQCQAIELIGKFETTSAAEKTQSSLIREIEALAFAQNPDISYALVAALIQAIETTLLSNKELLKALIFTLENFPLEEKGLPCLKGRKLGPPQLVGVLRSIIPKIREIHTQKHADRDAYQLIQLMSSLLNVMEDVGVQRLARETLYQPLNELVTSLKHSDDVLTSSSAQAAYAKQALARLSDNESYFNAALRNAGIAARCLANLYQVVAKQNVSCLIEIFKDIKTAVKGLRPKEDPWYEDVRFLKSLLSNFDLFKTALSDLVIGVRTSHDYVALCILNLVADEILRREDLAFQKDAVNFLVSLYSSNWGTEHRAKKTVLDGFNTAVSKVTRFEERRPVSFQEEVFNRLLDLAAHTEGALHQHIKDRLKPLDQSSLPRRSQKTPEKIDAIQENPSNSPAEFPNQLFSSLRDNATPTSTVVHLFHPVSISPQLVSLEFLKTECLKDLEIAEAMPSYVPLFASRELFSRSEETFKLEPAFAAFLESPKKVFLLFGDPKGGKSTFCRHMEQQLWKIWTTGKPIPLFISLMSVKEPFKTAVSETLVQRGVPKDQIPAIRNQYSFILFFDGYDALDSCQDLDLYTDNELHKWNAKVVITCRTRHLAGDLDKYRSYFTVPNTLQQLEEVFLAPFNPHQIAQYLNAYLSLHPTSWSVEQYTSAIRAISDLQGMIETPFLLRILVEVLPEIDQKRQMNPKHFSLTRTDLYNQFIHRWIAQGESFLMRKGVVFAENDTIEEDCLDFCKRLAVAMLKENTVSVICKPLTIFSNETASQWVSLFGTQDSRSIHVRSCAPIRKIAPHTYAFIHTSLSEYFGSRSVYERIIALPKSSPPSLDDWGYFATRSIVNKSEEIRFFVDYVQNPIFKQALFGLIRQSKSDPKASIAAANAITVLNAARVPFNREDFSGVRIPGADLSHGLLSRTNLSNADLTGVNLVGAFLSHTNLISSRMEGVVLGQKPYLNCSGMVFSISLSQQGTVALIGAGDNLEVWDYASSTRRSLLQRYKYATSMTIFPDGKQALLGSSDTTIRLLDLETGKPLRILEGHKEEVTSIAVSPDGKWALSGSKDKTVQLWDLQSGKPPHILRGHTSGVDSVAISPDGKWALSNSGDKIVRLWDLQTRKPSYTLRGHTHMVTSVAFSPDGKWALSGSWDTTVRLWNLRTGKLLHVLRGHTHVVTSVAISPDGKWALSGSYDNTVQLWDLQTGKLLHVFQGHTSYVNSVAFSPDGKWALSGSSDNTVRLWNLQTEKSLRSLQGHTGQVHSVAISPDGKWALSGRGVTVQLWDLQTGKPLHSLQGHTNCVTSVAISPDGKWALSGSHDNTVQLWDLQKGLPLHSFQGHTDFVTSVAFSQDGKMALSGSHDGTVRLWDLQKGWPLHVINQSYAYTALITSIAISPDGKKALFGTWDKTVLLLDLRTGELLHVLQGHTDCVASMAISPDGKWALLGSGDGAVRLWDLRTGKPLHVLQGHTHMVTRVAFSPDGKWALSGSGDGTVRLWDLQTRKLLHVLQGHTDNVTSVAISPDRKWALSGSYDCSIKYWSLFDKSGTFNPALVWSSHPTALTCQGLVIQGVQGLEAFSRMLLVQHGAQDKNNSSEDDRKV